MQPPLQIPEAFSLMPFPAAGIDLTRAFGQQMPRQLPTGVWARSTPSGVNVRTYEALSNRARGGARPGLLKYIPHTVNGHYIVQDVNVVVSTQGTSMQTSQSGRVVTVVAVSQGLVFYAPAGATSWTAAVNNTGLTPYLNVSGQVFSSSNNQILWFADGVNYRFFRPSDGSVNNWVASQGALPVDLAGNFPRLITTWRGRTVLSGLLKDGQNWFMSAVNDPTNFNYAPLNQTPTQAIAGNNSPQGLVGDVVTSICPFTDDVMIFFCDHEIWMMQGDPMAGGNLSLVTDKIGGTFGVCWEKDPFGTVYFVSNKTGIYTLVPGRQPQRISQPIEQLLNQIDTGNNVVRLLWDDFSQGMHFFITNAAAPQVNNHLFFELRTQSWWQEVFSNTNQDPICCVTFDGNTPGDRVPLIGSWDGYVRAVSPTAIDDDGGAIQSSVVLGPLMTAEFDDVMFKSMQAVMGANSGPVSYAVFAGPTAEFALSQPSLASGTWTSTNGGRNFTNLIRVAAHALWVKITANNQWQIEGIRALRAAKGKVRMRGI
jgi:hypothetical protein